MLATLALAVALQGPAEGYQHLTPDDVHRIAASDLLDQPRADRAYVRYLSLHAVDADRRDDFLKALLFWINSVTFRARFVPLTLIESDTLVRLDLRELGWDKHSRAEKLANARLSGAAFDLADESKYLDVWELMASHDPYFKVGGVNAEGESVRGWIDPNREADARALSKSRMFVLRADWWLARASFGEPDGLNKGFYNELMFLPESESDLYRMLGTDEQFVTRERQLRGGGRATGSSIVALHNRELELIPTQFGRGRWLWRTRDVINDRDGRSIRQSFVGSLDYDGREAIFSLPNGLHAYWLSDSDGNRVEEVPISIAQNKRDPHDARVMHAYSCVDCHGADGVRGFVDQVGELALSPDVGLAAVSPDPAETGRLKAKLEDYYFGDRVAQTEQQQAAYREAVTSLTGLDPQENATNYLEHVRAYTWRPVTLEMAAREFGVPADRVKGYLKASGHPDLLAIAAGQTASREAFEDAFKAGAVVPRFAWEE